MTLPGTLTRKQTEQLGQQRLAHARRRGPRERQAGRPLLPNLELRRHQAGPRFHPERRCGVRQMKTSRKPIIDSDQVDALLKVLNTHHVSDENGERRWTFATRNRDALDFSNVAVWTLKAMLAQAYYLGKVDGQKQALALLAGPGDK